MQRVIEPYVLVELRSGGDLLPPYVALGSRDQSQAELEAKAWAKERYGSERDYSAVATSQVATGQQSRTYRA
jgi:hypothetical protein